MIRYLKFLLFFCCIDAYGQHTEKVENVILITIDGCRWQEVFGGADSTLLYNDKFRKTEARRLTAKFWDADVQQRRKKLFPFLWGTVATQGRLYGNRNLNSKFSVRNKTNISYPGYAEIFTGYADTVFKSNDLVYNKNTNVFEFLDKQPSFKGKVASFASWNRANGFLNNQRSKFFINAGYDDVKDGELSSVQATLNSLQKKYVTEEHSRPDYITFLQAKEYLRKHHPKVLSIGLAWTDDMSHDGSYPNYLERLFVFDNMIQDLWEDIQSQAQYKDKTALFVVVDHGRGLGDQWTSHGPNIPHSNETWMAVMTPHMKNTGEVKNSTEYFNDQVAATIAALLGFDYKTEHPVGAPIQEITK